MRALPFASFLMLAFAACAQAADSPRDDVLIVGGGIAGLSAALEAADRGAQVRVLELNSVGGGHAVMAGGFALVGTPLQARQGIADNPSLAFEDWSRWAQTGNLDWIRRYAAESKPRVHDWLNALGVEFVVLVPSAENSVRRFHFTKGTAVHAVVPMMRAAYRHPRIQFENNVEVLKLIRRSGRVTGVEARELRSGKRFRREASAVIVATGGFETNIDEVRMHWLAGTRKPERLLAGAGFFALGSGLAMAEAAGARLDEQDRHTIFPNGLPDPRDPSAIRGLSVTHASALWVDAQGRRFVNESADPKVVNRALVTLQPMSYWMIFDSATRPQLRVKDAAWLDAKSIEAEIVSNPTLTSRAESLSELARQAGIPSDVLTATVARYNTLVTAGEDIDFGRFTRAAARKAEPVAVPPFYAVRLYPLTRKSLGGIAIDKDMRALDSRGRVVRGLYAAGETTGVGGFNGEHGMSGTFLGPSVLMGRIAGETIVNDLRINTPVAAPPLPTAAKIAVASSPSSVGLSADVLTALLGQTRNGYWHFERAHRHVLERKMPCESCHTPAFPPRTPANVDQRLAQLETCTRCH